MVRDQKDNPFGVAFSDWRERKRLSFLQIEQALKRHGFAIDQSAIGKYERAQLTPSGEFFGHLARAFEISEVEVLGWLQAIATKTYIDLYREYKRTKGD